MDQCDEDRVSPSKTALIGGPEVQRDEPEPDSKAESEPDSQLSCISFKSNQSTGRLIDFKSDEPSAAKRKKRGLGSEPGSEPGPSCMSFKSNQSTGRLIDFKSDEPPAAKRRKPEPQSEPGPSHVSFKSNKSTGRLIDFKSDKASTKIVDQQNSEVPSGPSAQQHQTQLDSIFMPLQDNIMTFVKNELKKTQKVLSPDYPEGLESQSDGEVLEVEDEKLKNSREALRNITVDFLKNMNQEELAERLQSRSSGICMHNLKSSLKKRFQCVFEGIAKAGNPALLNQIYTELYITEGGTGEVNDEHE
ncbi:hypothetical protein AMECASPLE_026624, partial [Ameca splendens]